MQPVTVYSKNTSSRLVYVLDWIFNDVFKCGYRLILNEQDSTKVPFFISYGLELPNGLYIPDVGLLWEQNIVHQKVDTASWKGIPVLCSTDAANSLPFDLFSSVFYLLSRYEEYYDYTPDKHGRYPAEESVLFKNDLLSRPIIDEWLLELYKLLKVHVSQLTLEPFAYQPTYDIDIAFSYKNKGLLRTSGAYLRSLTRGEFRSLVERSKVLSGSATDPFDCFSWLKTLHAKADVTPVYFILAALRTTAYDKNISPTNPAMQSLISELASEGIVALHPSYFSTEASVFRQEKERLEEITAKPIYWSRQHYVRMRLPDTYRTLSEHGIVEDWSMGYGAAFGFRAGTSRPFYWFDLERGVQTTLKVHPFCFMDSTAHYELRLSAEEAFMKLNDMTDLVQKAGGRLVTIFHNFSLGTEVEWKGWNEAYQEFLIAAAKKIKSASRT